MAAKTGTFGIGGPGTGPGHFTKYTHVWIPEEVAAAAAAGPSIEVVLAEIEAEEKAEKAAAEKVKCPKCGAYAGMPCRAGGGYGAAHAARVAKAAA